MTVADLQKYLSDFNPNAEVRVIVNNCPRPFDVAFGSAEGCTRLTADNVSFYIDGLKESVDLDK